MSIFDKVVGGVNKGVATVGANSKAMMEKARIKTVITNLESEKKQLAELLGMKVYEKFVESGESVGDDGVANFIAEISKRLEQIEFQKSEIKRIDDEVAMVTGANSRGASAGATCACGHVCTAGAKFCAKCGSPL